MAPTEGLASWLGLKRKKSRTPVLGRRELAVLEVLWEQDEQTAQQVLEALNDNQIVLSTVQSTLERLHRKNLLLRNKQGRAFVYTARLQKTAIISSLLSDIAIELGSGDMEPVISGFVEFLSQEDPDLQSRLRDAISLARNAEETQETTDD